MILITGCAGFIGSHLTESLLKGKEKIVGIDNFDPYYHIDLKKNNLSLLTSYKTFTFFPIDITNGREVSQLFKKYKFSTVIHLAARPGVAASLKDPFDYAYINIYGTLALLQQIRNSPDIQFIFSSSSSVYAGVKKIPFSEEDNTDIQLSPYGISKRSAETYCRLYHDLYDIPTTVLRFFTVYGPRVRPDMAIIKFLKAIDEGKEITVYNQGEVERDYTYISDIVSGIKKAIKKRYSFEIINLGNNQPIKLRNLIAILEVKLGKKAKIRNTPLPVSEMRITWANIDKAKKLLAWQPKTSFIDGLDKLLSLYKRFKMEK